MNGSQTPERLKEATQGLNLYSATPNMEEDIEHALMSHITIEMNEKFDIKMKELQKKQNEKPAQALQNDPSRVNIARDILGEFIVRCAEV